MKFHDKARRKQSTVFDVLLGDISKKADDYIRSEMPGYEETINENEHQYDNVSDRHTSYPPRGWRFKGQRPY